MIPDSAALMVFVAACLALLVTPGPAVLYIVARSIEQGRLAGLVSTAGISVGTLGHVAATAFGLSVFLSRSVLAFNTIKYLGAAYLLFMGIQRLSGRRQREQQSGMLNGQSLPRVFWQGVIVNLLNPKTTLFFLSFLPQFVDVNRGRVADQVLFLGILLVVLGFISDGTYAILAGSIGNRLQNNPQLQIRVRYVTGCVYIILGVLAAFYRISD